MSREEEKLGILMENRMWNYLDPVIDEALTENPTSSLALSAKGFLELKDDNLELAIGFFLESLRSDPDELLPKCGLHLCYYRGGEYKQAYECLIELLAQFPESEYVHVRNCWLHVKYRKRAKAEQAIETALQLFPENTQIMSSQVFLARECYSGDEILRLSTSLLELDPNNATAHLCAGEEYLKRNKLEEAENHFRICMELKPHEATARMLKLVEWKRTGRGLLGILGFALKERFLKIVVPGYARKKRMTITWDR